MSSGLLDVFEPATRKNPCPICEHPDWCLIARDGHAVLCKRIESRRRWKAAGWFHPLRRGGQSFATSTSIQRVRTATIGAPPPTRDDLQQIADAAFERGLPELSQLALQLGVSADALFNLRVGKDGHAWTFPMKDASGCVVGIRLRRPNGTKLAVTGGREGLFIPSAMPCQIGEGEPLFLPEGASDTAALLGIGRCAVGRPNCDGGVRLLIDLVRRRAVKFVVVVADQDEPGRIGADRVARALRIVCRCVRVIAPPPGIKDAREWVKQGANRTAVMGAVAAAPDYALRVAMAEGLS